MADGMRPDPFAPLPAAPVQRAAPCAAADDVWAPILPARLPLPSRFNHPRFGPPSAVWRYLGADEELLFAVARFDLAGGRKEIAFFCCGVNRRGAAEWRWRGPLAPRPLYRLDALASRPDAPVLICEGEKATDAAAKLFPELVAMTWPGGAQAVGKADWTPLAGRRVMVWPDHDAPGQRAAAEAAQAIREVGAASVALVKVPDGWPAKWDVADALPPGTTADALHALLAMAEPLEAPGDAPAQMHDGWQTPDMTLAERDALPPPAWPRDMFPEAWGDFIAEAAEARGCPPDFVGLATLAAVASRIGNARWGSPWQGWREPTTLWAAAVGLPSSGKSGGIDEAADALAAIEAEGNADWEERQRAFRTRKAEAEEIRKGWEGEVKAAVKAGTPAPMEPEAGREPDAPARRRVFTIDPTTEKVARLAAENPRGLLLLRDELVGWLGSMDRYGGGGGGDRAFWLQAYGGRPWVPDRVKDGDRGIEVPHLTWGILGGIQPDRVATMLTAGDDDGLAARFLYAWPAPVQPTRPSRPPPTGFLADALRRLEALPWTAPEPVTLPFTGEAADAIQDWRREVAAMEADAAGLFLSWVGKLPGFAVRLAVVFAHIAWLAEGTDAAPPAEVDADAIARACGFLADYAVPMARRVFGSAALPEAERDARRLAGWVLRQSPRPAVLNARDLRRMAGGPNIPTPERMSAALAELAAAGWCRPAPARAGQAPGRTRQDWAVNPAILGSASA